MQKVENEEKKKPISFSKNESPSHAPDSFILLLKRAPHNTKPMKSKSKENLPFLCNEAFSQPLSPSSTVVRTPLDRVGDRGPKTVEEMK